MPRLQTQLSTPRLSEIARYVKVPSGIVATAWPSVVGKCAELGIGFDPWQHGTGQIILAKRENGLYAAGIGGVVISIPRQVGKTYLIGAIVFALCLLHPNLTVIWTAHRLRTANETFRSMQALARRKKIAPHVLKVVLGSGEEEVQFRNGSRVLFGARERGFGVGFAEVDVLVLDEAQRATNAALDDLVPTTNQSKHPAGPLILMMGTPPRPTDPGEVFREKRKAALEDDESDGAYIEFSADPDADPADWKQVAKANPSHPSRTPREAILRMRKNLTPDSFLLEGLGIWPEVGSHTPPFPRWPELVSQAPPEDSEPPAAMGLDMSHDRVISIGGCWRTAGSDWHVELLEVDVTGNTVAAVEWLVDRARRRIPVVIDGMSPAASMIPELKARGVKVVTTGPQDMGKACGGFFDGVQQAHVWHVGQPQLDSAVQGSVKRPIGLAGAWGLDRRDPSVNIAPAVSVILAHFCAQSTKRSSGRSSAGRRATVL